LSAIGAAIAPDAATAFHLNPVPAWNRDGKNEAGD
jgi:hypothetical protein